MAVGYRKRITQWMTFLGGLYFVAEFLLPKPVLTSIGVADLHEQITMGFICVATMAVGLGIINLFVVHGSKILLKRKGWFESGVLLFGLIAMMALTIADWRYAREGSRRAASLTLLSDFAQVVIKDSEIRTPNVLSPRERIERLTSSFQSERETFDARLKEVEPFVTRTILDESIALFDRSRTSLTNAAGRTVVELPKEELLEFAKSTSELSTVIGKIERLAAERALSRQLYRVLFDGLFVSLGSAMFALLGVYIAAAAYRAFRIRSIEASLMMTAGLIVMLGQIPQGVQLYSGLPEMRLWLLEVPNSAAFRAIKIGAEVAGLIMAFRMWLSIESDRFGGGAE